jgi:hypothetical protein
VEFGGQTVADGDVMGRVQIGCQTIDGGGTALNVDTVIDEQVCLSGKVQNTGKTVIKVRYVPMDSTCIIVDTPDVEVLSTVVGVPRNKTITLDMGGMVVTTTYE